MRERVDRWLQGPRGRAFVAMAATRKNPVIDMTLMRTMTWRRQEDEADLLHALESVDPDALAGLSAFAVALALAGSVEKAWYWQEPWHDRLLARSVFDALLARLAAPLAAHPATQAWSEPVDLNHQMHIAWDGIPMAALDGFAQVIADDHRAAIEDERRPRPADPKANWSGRWWSIPPWTLPVTSPPTPFVGAFLLMVSEDGPHATGAIVRPVRVARPVRVLELRSAQDFADLVASAPFDVTMSRRHDWYRATGEVRSWRMPDWTQVAQVYDAIHLTVDAYLETAGRVLPIAGGATVMAGWAPDSTRWLAERLTLGEPRRWMAASAPDDPVARWYPADDQSSAPHPGGPVTVPDPLAPPLPRSPIPFTKMHGSGNDFIVIDHRTPLIPPAAEAAFVRAVCLRRTGIGADGVVFIEDADPAGPEVDFRWRYVNADGSEGAMCGNGAMCGARFAVLNGIAPARCAFQTPSGLVRAEVDGAHVRLAMGDAGPYTPPRAVETSIGDLAIASIPVGVPHAVIVTDDADAWPPVGAFEAIGRELRWHAAFAPAGTNVDVIAPLGPDRIRMRTYERGVEAETLACGTGAVASAIAASQQGLVDSGLPVEVLASGGWPLVVSFTWDAATQTAREITLAGRAVVVGRGVLDPEAWVAIAGQ